MAKKLVKETNKKTTKVEMVETFNKVKNTAIKVNTQVVETTTDVMDDMRENGKYWVETVSQKVKETVDNFDVAEVTTDLIDMTLDNGKKIQNLSAKALDGGFKIAAKQQDIVFTTLETLKGQLTKNASRFKDLFNMN
jgi:hypothetical protein